MNRIEIDRDDARNHFADTLRMAHAGKDTGGSQFFMGAWNNFRNHHANMDTLVALGTGSAWLYSTLVALWPGLFPAGTSGMYFDVAVIVIALVVLGQALEMRAKSRSSAAIQKLFFEA